MLGDVPVGSAPLGMAHPSASAHDASNYFERQVAHSRDNGRVAGPGEGRGWRFESVAGVAALAAAAALARPAMDAAMEYRRAGAARRQTYERTMAAVAERVKQLEADQENSKRALDDLKRNARALGIQ